MNDDDNLIAQWKLFIIVHCLPGRACAYAINISARAADRASRRRRPKNPPPLQLTQWRRQGPQELRTPDASRLNRLRVFPMINLVLNGIVRDPVAWLHVVSFKFKVDDDEEDDDDDEAFGPPTTSGPSRVSRSETVRTYGGGGSPQPSSSRNVDNQQSFQQVSIEA